MFSLKNRAKVLKAFIALLVCAQCQINDCMKRKHSDKNSDERLVTNNKKVKKVDLLNAAIKGDLEGVKEAINQDADVNQANNYGVTPLMVAAGNGHLEVVKYLCENKADVNKKTKNSCTPLMYAAVEGHLEVVKYLCENKADVNQADNNGVTPLMSAALHGHLEVVKYLLYMILQEARSNAVTNKLSKKFILKNINLGAKENIIIHWQSQIIACKKSTALHIDCLLKNKEIIKKMLLFKPDLSAQDENGKKAIDYLPENDVDLMNLMSHPNCHRPTNEEDNEYYNRTVLMGANNQTGGQKAFVHNPVKYNDSECFDLSLNYLNSN